MAAEVAERYGYVRRFSYPGERWHIVPVAPTSDGWGDYTPALCGRRPFVGWGTICAPAPWMRVCRDCQRRTGDGR